jgi:methylthioribose-1-phosphate isomerase
LFCPCPSASLPQRGRPITFQTVARSGNAVRILDQTRLPDDEVYVELTSAVEVASAIRELRVRGAPAIGITAGLGVAAELQGHAGADREALAHLAHGSAQILKLARPTAVNLAWAVDRVLRAALTSDDLIGAAWLEAGRIREEDLEACHAIGRYGSQLLPAGARVLTHCNAGGLATAGWGTALGVVRQAFRDGRLAQVFACETRPVLQGARLTAWELQREEIPCTLIVDSAAASLLGTGRVDAVIVGADRIAANGDTANKIGTYSLALAARAHSVPFYVAAPASTVDLGTSDSAGIEIEQRDPAEVTAYHGFRVAPAGSEAWNPAFDVTPADLVTAFVTDAGVIEPPFGPALRRRFGEPREAVHA